MTFAFIARQKPKGNKACGRSDVADVIQYEGNACNNKYNIIKIEIYYKCVTMQTSIYIYLYYTDAFHASVYIRPILNYNEQ